MSYRFVLSAIVLAVSLASCPHAQAAQTTPAKNTPPNIVIIFIDDMGYADIGPFGAEGYETPHLDRMARAGRKFTDFHAATAVCSASRAALLTGCYPERVSILGALYPHSSQGLNSSETTLAELCRQQGYATAIFGKWHLGDYEPFLPLQHGFDEYFGLPYSNDMWPHPNAPSNPLSKPKTRFPNLPLIEGNRVVDDDVTAEDQALLTKQYTEHAVDFINRNSERPFFLYVPHSMVHVPLFASEDFLGKSGAGLFGDVVMELDWSVGQILDTLDKNNLSDNTLVVFTSDNGPWLNYGDHAGSAGPLREGKGTMFEGGYREPCIMHWPGKIPPGTSCDELATTMDLLPTVAKLIGAEVPTDRIIDGKDISPLLFAEPNARSPHDALYCYYGGQLQAIRDRRWKLHFPHGYRTLAGKPAGRGGIPVNYSQDNIALSLFDLKNDVGETTDLSAEHPEIVERLKKRGELARQDLGDKLTNRQGENVRPPGRLK